LRLASYFQTNITAVNGHQHVGMLLDNFIGLIIKGWKGFLVILLKIGGVITKYLQ
jgi:hypothetical protein